MTPLMHEPDDDKPSTGEVVFAAVLFVVTILTVWLLGVINTVMP